MKNERTIESHAKGRLMSYALLVAMVALFAIGTASMIGHAVHAEFEHIAHAVQGATNG